MDINSLLAKEQISLLLARFEGVPVNRDEHLAAAAAHGNGLRATSFPHRWPCVGVLA